LHLAVDAHGMPVRAIMWGCSRLPYPAQSRDAARRKSVLQGLDFDSIRTTRRVFLITDFYFFENMSAKFWQGCGRIIYGIF
jgi:hypothetical protein